MCRCLRLAQVLQNGSFLVSIMALCLASSPYFILPFLPIMVLFWLVYSFFRRTSREIKRLEGVSRSPIYSSFGEMLTGIATIRAFDRSHDFLTRHYAAVDQNASLFLLFWLTSRWLALRLDCLAVGVMFILSFMAVILCQFGLYSAISPSLLGLGLIYAIQLVGLLQWSIRLTVELEVSRSRPQPRQVWVSHYDCVRLAHGRIT
jgi:ABC-type multidrug transport system fused ATPase/permease subunit